MEFSKNAQNLLIRPENWKSQNQFFPIKNGSKKFDDEEEKALETEGRKKKGRQKMLVN